MVSHIKTAKKVVRNVPGEMLHRAASYVIIAEGVFHTFKSLKLVVVAGIFFVVVEVVDICLDDTEEKEDAGV